MSTPTPAPIPEGMRVVREKNVFAPYIAALSLVAYALIFPLYTVMHYALAGAAALILFLILRLLLPEHETLQPDPKRTELSGNSTADTLLSESRALLSKVAAHSAKIKDPHAVQQIDEVEDLAHAILSYVLKNPESATALRRFANYYLPTFEGLVVRYLDLQDRGVVTDALSESLLRIFEAFDTMEVAFTELLDRLHEDDAIDLDAELSALKGVFSVEGLLDAEMAMPDSGAQSPAQQIPAAADGLSLPQLTLEPTDEPDNHTQSK